MKYQSACLVLCLRESWTVCKCNPLRRALGMKTGGLLDGWMGGLLGLKTGGPWAVMMGGRTDRFWYRPYRWRRERSSPQNVQ